MGDDAFGRAPVGSGAYKFVSWTAGDNITVERNDEYWRDKSILKTIKFRIITEAASRTIDLESGGVDITLGLPTTDATVLKKIQIPSLSSALVLRIVILPSTARRTFLKINASARH